MTTSMALTRDDVIIGVDTHKDRHEAVSLDGLGARLGDQSISVSLDGYSQLVDWATTQGSIWGFAIEGTGSFGAGLTRYLQALGYRVLEANRPPRNSQRRANGKDDTIDAEHAARAALTGALTATPRDTTGITEAVRVTKIARDLAVQQRALMLRMIKSMMIPAPEGLRAELEDLTDAKLINACAGLDTAGNPADPVVALHRLLGSIADTYRLAHQQVRQHTHTLSELVHEAAPSLMEVFGVGPDTAAELLVCAGNGRIRSETALAKLRGVCPIPAGSGKTNGRHRLNRGGNRAANAALYRVVIVRLRYCDKTKAYLKRRTADGLTKKEIIRCLKRYLARELFQHLPKTQPLTTPEQNP